HLENGEDQPVELLSREPEDPTQMRMAAPADRDLPGPAGEPRERRLGGTDVNAARRRREAPDVVLDAGGVHERVLVRPTHLHAAAPIGDPVIAYDAPQRVVV